MHPDGRAYQRSHRDQVDLQDSPLPGGHRIPSPFRARLKKESPPKNRPQKYPGVEMFHGGPSQTTLFRRVVCKVGIVETEYKRRNL